MVGSNTSHAQRVEGEADSLEKAFHIHLSVYLRYWRQNIWRDRIYEG